jgi:uncharacterized protein (DUF983 family)
MERKKFATAPYKVIDESKKKKKGQLWCPYCGEWRTFKPKYAEGYPRCSYCNISTEDYWVKDVNKLWEVSIKPRG